MRAGLLVTLTAGVLLAGAVAPPPAADAATVLFANGATIGTPVNDPVSFRENFLGGAYRDDSVVFLDYPASLWPITGLFDPTLGRSVDVGTASMVDLVTSTPGPVVVSGVSEGAIVAQRAQAALNDDPGVPSDTTFILVADPNLGAFSGLHGIRLPILAYRPEPPAASRFTTVVVVNQYDLVADPIVRPWNPLTALNAVLALAYVHPHAQDSDLTAVPPENITTTTNVAGGITTTYLVPTEQLPLTMPLRQLGVPGGLVDAIDGGLRPVIDAGYRPLPCGTAAARPGSSRTARTAATAATRPAGSSSRSGAAGTSARRSPAR